MSEIQDQESKDEGESLVHCRRTNQQYSHAEHKRCPYCYGGLADVADGAHGEFCDFNPDEDPIAFGFPPDGTRHESG